MNTAVRPDHAPFSCGRLSRFECQVDHLNDSCQIIAVNQIFESLLCSTEAAHRQPVNCLQFRRPNIHPCPNVPLKSSHAGSLLCQSQPFLAGVHYLLGLKPSPQSSLLATTLFSPSLRLL